MSFNQKLLAFENWIIDVLTVFTWWTEVRFDKDNIHWARIFTVQALIFACCHSFSLAEIRYEKMEYFMCGFNSTLAFIFAVCGAYFVLFKESALSDLREFNPQGTPNPCRVSKMHSMWRRFWMFLVLMHVISFDDSFATLNAVFFFVAWFVLACDSIPPGEKSRRKHMNEFQEMNLAPIKQ